MICSIHQPNFMPWFPLFQKIEESDIFIILKHCQFEKNNYQNRFSFEDKWYTMSVNKGMEPIVNKRYINHESDWKKIKKLLPKYYDILSVFDECISENLAETNSKIIEKFVKFLDIKTQIVYDYDTELKGTDRLVDLCLKNGADTYLSGVSGGNYMDLEKFTSNGIEVIFQQNIVKKHAFEMLHERLS